MLTFIRKSGFYPVAVLVIAMLCVSLNHVIGRGVHADVPPVGLGFWRWFLGALIILLFIWPNRMQSFSIIYRNLRYFFTLGFLLAFSSTAVLVALHFTTATNAAMINSTQPIITVLLLWAFVHDELRWIQKCGVLLAFLGVIVMLSKGNLQEVLAMNIGLGDLIALTAMVGLATYSILVRKMPAGLSIMETSFAIIMTGSIVLLPFYILESVFYHPVAIDAVSLYTISGMAVFVVVCGMTAWTLGIQLLGPAISSVFLNLIPVFGAVLAAIFLGEKFHSYHLLCLVLVFAGMLMVLGRNLFSPKQVDQPV